MDGTKICIVLIGVCRGSPILLHVYPSAGASKLSTTNKVLLGVGVALLFLAAVGVGALARKIKTLRGPDNNIVVLLCALLRIIVIFFRFDPNVLWNCLNSGVYSVVGGNGTTSGTTRE